jgi:hypothetical protein
MGFHHTRLNNGQLLPVTDDNYKSWGGEPEAAVLGDHRRRSPRRGSWCLGAAVKFCLPSELRPLSVALIRPINSIVLRDVPNNGPF